MRKIQDIDFIEKPIDLNRHLVTVRNALDKGIEASMPELLTQAAPPKPQRNVRGARYFGKKG